MVNDTVITAYGLSKVVIRNVFQSGSLRCTPATNIILYVNCISIKKKLYFQLQCMLYIRKKA